MRKFMRDTLVKLAHVTAGLAFLGTATFAQTPTRGGTLTAIIQPEPPILMLGLNQQGPTLYAGGQIYQTLLTIPLNSSRCRCWPSPGPCHPTGSPMCSICVRM